MTRRSEAPWILANILSWIDGMEHAHWPSERQSVPIASSTDDVTEREPAVPWGAPVLEHGTFGAATLVPSDGRFVWRTALNKVLRVTSTNYATVFPATRSPDTHPQTSRHTRAEHAAYFLRRYLPDVDIPAALLHKQMVADAADSRSIDVFDPDAGNLIELAPSLGTRKALILFPVGELGADLNASLLDCNPVDGYPTLIASSKPAYNFPSPIKQIVPPPPAARGDSVSSVIVRTHTAMSLMAMSEHECDLTGVQLTPRADILRDDVQGRPIVDATLLNESANLLTVTDRGQVFRANVYQAGKVVQPLFPNSQHSELETLKDGFWRFLLDADGTPGACKLVSRHAIRHLDQRSAAPSVAFSFASDRSPILSAESSIEDRMIRLATSTDIIWLDERFGRQPLLQIKHGRAHDYKLSSQTIVVNGEPYTFLSSPRNGLVTVYDVSRDASGLVCATSLPQILPWLPGRTHVPHRGVKFLSHQSQGNSHASAFQLGLQYDVHRVDINLTRWHAEAENEVEMQDVSDGRATHVWSQAMQEVDVRGPALRDIERATDAKNYTRHDLSGAYERIFKTEATGPDADVPHAEDLSEGLAEKFHRLGTAESHLAGRPFTLSDIVHSSFDANGDVCAQSFWEPGSKRSIALIRAKSLSCQALEEGAAWGLDLRTHLAHTLPGIENDRDLDYGMLVERLGSHDVKVTYDNAQALHACREELATDLTLGSQAFALRVDPPPDTRVNPANGEPPHVQFNILRPTSTAHYRTSHLSTEELEEAALDTDSRPHIGTLGTRLLLADWDIGTSVEEYVYVDPYDEDELGAESIPTRATERWSTAMAAAASKTRPMSKPTMPDHAPKHAIPPVLAAPSVPTVAHAGGMPSFSQVPSTAARIDAQSQGLVTSHSLDASQLQSQSLSQPQSQPEMFASTQVLPGPHGGRPGHPGKKPAKKRMGGF
ncbi:hypothetical protein CONPUDRAFT_162374 [Coniophora puteana RWD-64-598 SS2]|uniref:RRN6 K-rich C-terminal domain-containing protein n=1 Tax=Coniophora puteana (strain RWD-64-598) TaxID=741705 RepID=A0A5M3N1B7_CONPW|nr:uncharacterized protein CONPUDRAFT_162374 [Coniophora puteana RWD-64-598 SS2]EIW85096.1 hypothetical protein CONPUDRAFT_162374 [Coniophora puteana RWD-64-598 SS2]